MTLKVKFYNGKWCVYIAPSSKVLNTVIYIHTLIEMKPCKAPTCQLAAVRGSVSCSRTLPH